MKGLIYLYQRTLANKIKKSLKQPKTYLVLIFIILYIAMIFFSFNMLIKEEKFGTVENLVTILAGIILFLLPSNFISYAKRRGLLFRPSETHFVFVSPVSPKMALMFAAVKSFSLNLLIGIVIFILGIIWFDAGVLQMLVYFLFFVVFESILEASIIIFCYGNERLHERFFKGLTIIMYLFMALMVGIGAYLLLTREAEFGVIREYLAIPAIQLIPVIGWNVAVVHLIFTGPDVVNTIGTVLFLISTLGMFITARKMKCTGEYYEDAAKFAEEYQSRRESQKKGVVSLGFGKKKKYKEAVVEYKGNYAKAIYFRQMLEYKKNKTFIFGWNTLLCFGLGILIAVYGYMNDVEKAFGAGKVFVIPAVVSYIVFIFSGYATKWAKELENPYTYLIPDSPLKKVWYATKIEHIRGIIDGILVTLPGAVIFGIGPVLTVLTVLLYICLMANRLYYGMLADAIIGNSLGTTGRTLVKMLLQGLAIGAGITAAAVGGVLWGMEVGFILMIVIVGVLTFAGAAGASVSFMKMEVLD